MDGIVEADSVKRDLWQNRKLIIIYCSTSSYPTSKVKWTETLNLLSLCKNYNYFSADVSWERHHRWSQLHSKFEAQSWIPLEVWQGLPGLHGKSVGTSSGMPSWAFHWKALVPNNFFLLCSSAWRERWRSRVLLEASGGTVHPASDTREMGQNVVSADTKNFIPLITSHQ